MNYTTEPLKLGATGRAVTFLQYRLGIAPHGDFDVETETALKRAQALSGNQPDGVYGPLTNAALTMAHTTVLADSASLLDVDVRALKALLTVETVGRGFYQTGMPKILLERHYVYKLASDAQRDALTGDVCDPTPGGYVGGLGEWTRFDKVAAVSLDLAVQSCSWGLAQIMGIQCDRLGLTPIAWMIRNATNEDKQLDCFGRYLHSNDALREALRRCDWPEVARLYNGPDYAKNAYDKKLADAYDRIPIA